MRAKEAPRGFKGIWIPAELWLDPNLSCVEIVLCAEINSLDQGEGCCASDGYLSDFLGCSRSTLQSYLASLKAKGKIETVAFDGRRRVIRCQMSGDLDNRCPETQTADVYTFANSSISENKVENKDEIIDVVINKSRKKKILFLDFIRMTQEEYNKILTLYEKADVDRKMDDLNNWLGSSGQHANNRRSHYHTILNFFKRDGVKQKQPKCEKCGAYIFNGKYQCMHGKNHE